MRTQRCSGCQQMTNLSNDASNWICPKCKKMNMVMRMGQEDAVGDTLKARGETHGDYGAQALTSQGLKTGIRAHRRWDRLTHIQRESLEMIAVKISRILNGDPNHADSWRDIAGYAKLVEDALKGGKDE